MTLRAAAICLFVFVLNCSSGLGLFLALISFLKITNFSNICHAAAGRTPANAVNFLGQSLIQEKPLLAGLSTLPKLQERPLGCTVSHYLPPPRNFGDSQPVTEVPAWS